MLILFFFSSRRRHTRWPRDWSSDVCSSDLIHHLMRQAGIDMTSGGVDLNPYQHKQRIACTHCPFLSVCQFDPTLEGNDYHKLSEMKDDEILNRIHEGEEIGRAHV